MPSLQEVSFLITRKYYCYICKNEWSSRVRIPPAGINCREHTTVKVLLQKSLHASSSVFYGNITIEDVKDEYRDVLSRKLKNVHGIIPLECEPREPPNWSCPDCLYKNSEDCNMLCSRDSDYRLTQILDTSIQSDTTGGGMSCPKSGDFSQLYSSAPGTLDENKIQGNNFSDYSLTHLLNNSKPSEVTSQNNPAAARPVPAPRISLRSTSSDQPGHGAHIPDQSPIGHVEAQSLSSGNTTDDDIYEQPVTAMPSLPRKTYNIFPYTVPLNEIRDALLTRSVPHQFAIVELEVQEGTGGQMKTPWIIICPAMAHGFKMVLQMQNGRLFIHKRQKFDTLKQLLRHYSENPTSCGAYLRNQLTHCAFTNIQQRRRPL
ncbi:uncharacterized protein [Watersipora subatra]|uniref:uncharacterized protein n=1 Tax=Watersipora subatra TaxID=2589382 RepID=UPI00355AF70A